MIDSHRIYHAIYWRVIPRLHRLKYEMLYKWLYDPFGSFKKPCGFDPAITNLQIVESFGYSRAIVRWMADKGDETLRVNYPLNSNSIVFDVGGFSGAWADEIFRRYGSRIHIFEPASGNIKNIERRFRGNPKIQIHRYGLADRNRVAKIGLAGQGTSVYNTRAVQEEVQMRDICEVIKELEIEKVDLIKINIEGGEYALLRRMIDGSVVNAFTNLQIQFHKDVPVAGGARRARREIRRQLARTHSIVYDYRFVWEGWQIN